MEGIWRDVDAVMQANRLDSLFENDLAMAAEDDDAVGVFVPLQGRVAAGLDFEIAGQAIQISFALTFAHQGLAADVFEVAAVALVLPQRDSVPTVVARANDF